MTDTVVLLSGGLDSAVLLASIRQDHRTVYALSVDYGQRHRRELWSAYQIARYYGATNVPVRLPPDLLSGSTLTGDEGLVEGPATVVPGRNLLFASLALSFAVSRGCQTVYLAPTLDDRPVYPDCRAEFWEAVTSAAVQGYQIEVRVPFVGITKRDVVSLGRRLAVPFDMTWSCYDPQGYDPLAPASGRPCSRCGACVIRRQAETVSGPQL